MGSPDARPYIDLVLRDLDPQDVYELALADLATKIPGISLREGAMESLAFEAMAVQVSELIYAANRIPSSVVLALLRLNGIVFDEGAPPTASILYEFATTAQDGNLVVPAGSTATLQLSDTQEPIVFTTLTDYTVPNGQSKVTVPVVGDRYTDDANGYAPGTLVTSNDSILYLNKASLASVVVDGRDEESDEDYFQRGTQKFSRMTSTLVTPSHFVSAMLDQVYVERAFAIDNYESTSSVGRANPGHITLFGYGNNVLLTQAQQADLLSKITPNAIGALSIHYNQPYILTQNVSLTVERENDYDNATVTENIRVALSEFLNPMTWPWSRSLRVNDIISVVSGVVGVDFVVSVQNPTGDTAFNYGDGGLFKLGTLTVTVQNNV